MSEMKLLRIEMISIKPNMVKYGSRISERYYNLEKPGVLLISIVVETCY